MNDASIRNRVRLVTVGAGLGVLAFAGVGCGGDEGTVSASQDRPVAIAVPKRTMPSGVPTSLPDRPTFDPVDVSRTTPATETETETRVRGASQARGAGASTGTPASPQPQPQPQSPPPSPPAPPSLPTTTTTVAPPSGGTGRPPVIDPGLIVVRPTVSLPPVTIPPITIPPVTIPPVTVPPGTVFPGFPGTGFGVSCRLPVPDPGGC